MIVPWCGSLKPQTVSSGSDFRNLLSSSTPSIYRWAVGGPGRSKAKKSKWYLENRDHWETIQQTLKNQNTSQSNLW